MTVQIRLVGHTETNEVEVEASKAFDVAMSVRSVRHVEMSGVPTFESRTLLREWES